MSLVPIKLPLTAGVNLFTDPLMSGELRWTENLYPHEPGVLAKRLAMQPVDIETRTATDAGSAIRSRLCRAPSEAWMDVRDFCFIPALAGGGIIQHCVGPSLTSAERSINVWEWSGGGPVSGQHHLTVRGGGMLDYANDQDATDFISAFYLLPASVDYGRLFFLPWKQYVYVLTGTELVLRYSQAAGFEEVTFDKLPVMDGFAPSIACVHQGRVVYAWGHRLVWSDRGDPQTIGLDVWEDPTETFTCLASISQGGVEQPTETILLALTDTGGYAVTSEPDETFETSGDKPTFGRFTERCDCVSHATFVRTPAGYIWCGKDDVWAMSQGRLPVRIGTKIRPRVKLLPPTLAWLAHASFDDGRYVLALPGDGQSISPGKPLQHHWWLDLRGGISPSWEGAGWFGPMVYKPHLAWLQDSDTYGTHSEWGTTCLRSGVYDGHERMHSIIPIGVPAGFTSEQSSGSSHRKLRHCVLVSFDGVEPVDRVLPALPPVTTQRRASSLYEDGQLVGAGPYVWAAQREGTTSASAIEDVGGAAADALRTTNFANVSPSLGPVVADGSTYWLAYALQSRVGGVTSQFRPLRAHLLPDELNYGYIRTKWETAQMTAGDPVVTKRLDHLELAYESNNPALLNYQFYPPNWTEMAYPGKEYTLKHARDESVSEDVESALDSAEYPADDIVAGYRALGRDYIPSLTTKRRGHRYQVAQVQEADHTRLYIDETCQVIVLRGALDNGSPVHFEEALDVMTALGGKGWYTASQVVAVIESAAQAMFDDILEGAHGVEVNLSLSTSFTTQRLSVTLITGPDWEASFHPLWMHEDWGTETSALWADNQATATKLAVLLGEDPDVQLLDGIVWAPQDAGDPGELIYEAAYPINIIQPVELKLIDATAMLEVQGRRTR